jgi:hypothetical protein
VAGGPTGKAFVYDARTGADLASYQLTPAGALAIREARLGANHPTTAHSLGNLAAILHTQGDLDGARRLHERTLQIREACLGPDHPDTARSHQDLAALKVQLDAGP